MDAPGQVETKVLDLTARDVEAVRLRAERRAKQAAKQAAVEISAIMQAKTAAEKRELKEAAERSKVAKRRSRELKMAKAKELFLTGKYSRDWIAVELGVSAGTVRYWLKGVKLPEPEPEPEPEPGSEPEPEPEPGIAPTEQQQQELGDSYLLAREEEEARLMEIAEGHGAPSDKYQAYVAASAIRMLRDSFKLIRGPRTIRELSELDQLIRRNLGLNPRGGSGSGGSVRIDVSILNNTKAVPQTGLVIPVEPEEPAA